MGAKDVVRYLVVKRLSGDTIAVLAVKEYLVDGESPSTIGHRYRISKYGVRGYAQRVLSKVGYHYSIATEIVKAVFPAVMSLDPVILRLNGSNYCLLCGREVSASKAAAHVMRHHRNYVEQVTEHILRTVKVGKVEAH